MAAGVSNETDELLVTGCCAVASLDACRTFTSCGSTNTPVARSHFLTATVVGGSSTSAEAGSTTWASLGTREPGTKKGTSWRSGRAGVVAVVDMLFGDVL